MWSVPLVIGQQMPGARRSSVPFEHDNKGANGNSKNDYGYGEPPVHTVLSHGSAIVTTRPLDWEEGRPRVRPNQKRKGSPRSFVCAFLLKADVSTDMV
jgi:hypothetical protein